MPISGDEFCLNLGAKRMPSLQLHFESPIFIHASLAMILFRYVQLLQTSIYLVKTYSSFSLIGRYIIKKVIPIGENEVEKNEPKCI